MTDKTTQTSHPSIGDSASSIEARTEAILRTTLEELAAVGYAGLSIETIAARVGIAKTTIYRRYPTKAQLVHAAIQKFVRAHEEPPDTGSLRGDLVALGQMMVNIAGTTVGKSLLRLGFEKTDPELVVLSQEAEEEASIRNAKVAHRAMARGEMSSPQQLEELAEVLIGAILFKLVFKRQQVDEAEIGRVVDMMLNGVTRPIMRSGSRRRSAEP